MKIKKIFSIISGLFMAVCLIGCGKGEELNNGKVDQEDKFPYWQITQERETAGQHYKQDGIEFPSELWQTPSAERYEDRDKNGVKAYFISSLEGEKVFCYVGLPESASKDNPVPAVVCVHGATGTAFYNWVELWNSRGYAAIAMDTEGKMPTADASLYYSVATASVKPHGPANAAFTDSNKPVTEQWVYHAVAAVISSTSFISSFEEVDSSRIGITGVSYGGFLTCLAAGYDDRYVFAAPVYGCLSNSGSSAEFGSYIDGNAGAEIWDETGPLAASNSVFLFVNGNTDNFFPLDSTKKCAAACKQAALCIKQNYEHGHSQGADVNEVFAFADEIFANGTPLVRITDVNAESGELSFALPVGVSIKNASQIYTLENVLNGTTKWNSEKIEWEGNYAFYSSEESKAHWYVEIEDDRGFIVACPIESRK